MEHLILSCLESRLEEGGSLYGRFLLGPFRVGQGITVATALRRALLSELDGIAITAVEINGAIHQYSSIVGVRESALDITLNLKQVVLTGGAISELPAIGYINVLGPKEVLGSDLRLPNGISCVNRNQHIATLSSNGSLVMKFVISSGKGYSTHHSAPSQILKPSIVKWTSQSDGSLSSPFSSQETTGDMGSRSFLVARSKEGRDRIGYDSRYGRRLARRLVLLSGSAQDIVSYVQERRLGMSFSWRKDERKADPAINKSTMLHQQQDKVALADQEQQMSFSSLTESTFKGFERDVGAQNENSLGHNGGFSSNPRKSFLFDSEGWSSEPQTKGSLDRKARKDSFFAALAQKSNDLGQKKENATQGYQANPIGPEASKETNDFFNVVGNTSLLPIDAVFMPVNSVNFSVQTDEQWQEPKERVILEVCTNGSLSPRQALHEAATCLVYMFSLFRQSPSSLPLKLSRNSQPQYQNWVEPDRLQPMLFEASGGWDPADASAESCATLARKKRSLERQGAKVPVIGPGKGTDLENLHLSVQAYVALKQLKINTLHELFICASADLKKMLGGNQELSFEILSKMREVTL